MNPQDLEQLSAYLDGQVGPDELARLESRLQTEPDLERSLGELRATRALLRGLTVHRAPRNLTLTRAMVGRTPPLPASYPVLRFAGVAAALLLGFSFAVNALAPIGIPTSAAIPGGMGGGGGAETFSAEATAPAALEPPAVPAVSPTSGIDARQELAAPQLKGTQPDQDVATGSAPALPKLIPDLWQLALGLLAAGFALAAWAVRLRASTRWRE
jgi:anti-sigma factor RsiW